MLLRGLFYFIANAAVILLMSNVFTNFTVNSWSNALVFVFVLTLFNWTITPILKILAFPLTIVTLGLFNFIINILVVWFTADILEGVDITGDGLTKFGTSLVIAVALSVVTQVLEQKKS